MEVAEQQWKKQLVEAVREATEDEEASVGSPKEYERNGGYSFPLPSNHPFVDTKRVQATPQRGSAPIGVNRGDYPVGTPGIASPIKSSRIDSPIDPSRITSPAHASRIASPLSPSDGFRTPSDGTLLTQSLNTTKTTDSSLLSFDSLLNDVMRQANQLREVADYYERQE